jgi:predicted AAA+ superfamily ATPase
VCFKNILTGSFQEHLKMTDSIHDMDVKDIDKLGMSDLEAVVEENKELLDHIDWLCNSWDREDVERILLFGNIGAGKSSIVNTIIKALSGKYIPKAKVGQGSTQSKTFSLERYYYLLFLAHQSRRLRVSY